MNDFFTFTGYMKKDDNALTASMEDYLEMIIRLCRETGFTRVHELAAALNVQPSSATKMVQKLAELNLLHYEKYGVIILDDRGKKAGEALLRRHQIIEEFLGLLGIREERILEQTEKMEHTLSPETVGCIEDFIRFFKEQPEVGASYAAFRQRARGGSG